MAGGRSVPAFPLPVRVFALTGQQTIGSNSLSSRQLKIGGFNALFDALVLHSSPTFKSSICAAVCAIDHFVITLS